MHQHYIASTIGYGIVGIFAVIEGLYFTVRSEWLLVLICAMIAYVAWDNFFCGPRARNCGYPAKGRYVIPPIIK